MTYKNESFSEFLSRVMSDVGLTNKELAARFNISSQAVSLWRSGKNMPKSSVIDDVRSYLISLDNSGRAALMSEPKESHLDGSYGLVQIPEYDVQAAAGAGLEVPDLQTPSKIWTVPRAALENARVSSLDNLAILTIKGDSMVPKYAPGDRVLIDRGDNIVRHDGSYVLWNQFGLIVKMIQVLPGVSGSGPMFRIISKNTDYPPYECPVQETQIHGRVVGRWVWE